MNPTQVARSLSRRIAARQPVLLIGAPGVGKTDLVSQAAAAANADIIVSHPVVADPTDAKGLPFPSADGKSATFLPYGELAQALAATKPTVWFIDDIGQAAPAVQAAFMQLLLTRRINGHKLPDFITFVAASNRKQDRAGVVGLLEPVKSRFTTIIEVTPDVDSWINWALTAGLPAPLIAFIQLFGDKLLHAPAPTYELINSPSPRTWHNVARLLMSGLDEDPVVAKEELSGAVGLSAATEFINFVTNSTDLPSIEDLLLYPDTVAIPKTLSARWLVVTAVATRATSSNFSALCLLASRLFNEGHAELAAYLVRKSIVVNPESANSLTYAKMLSGEMSVLFS